MGKAFYDLHEPDDDLSPLDVSLVSETSFRYMHLCTIKLKVVLYLSMILFERYDFNPGYYSVNESMSLSI